MKETIKQLEKGFKKLPDKNKKFIFTRVKGVDYISNDIHEVLIKNEKLQTLQEVCKEIKELDWDIKNIHYNGHREVFEKGEVTCAICKVLIDIECKIEEQLKKLEGEE